MKIFCECGNTIIDNTDFISYKAHITPDENWFELLDMIHEGVVRAAQSVDGEAEKIACEVITGVIKLQSVTGYQCQQCGRLDLGRDGGKATHIFRLEKADSQNEADAKAVFKGKTLR